MSWGSGFAVVKKEKKEMKQVRVHGEKRREESRDAAKESRCMFHV